MAVATPVFERKISQETREEQTNMRYGGMTADELHNARISDNLARLLNPENKIKDVVASIDAHGTQVLQPVQQADATVAPVQPAVGSLNGNAEVYAAFSRQSATTSATPVILVKNARANADIFRADSPVNAALNPSAQHYAAAAVQAVAEEEENEDLRPTSTTIQYQTIGADGAVLKNGVSEASSTNDNVTSDERMSVESKISLTKRDKIIIGVILGLILAVFVLIIVNSAIISNLNSDIDALEGMADSANAAYSQVLEEIEDVKSYDNLYNFAVENGLLKN